MIKIVELTEMMKNAIEDIYVNEFSRTIPKRCIYLATASKEGIPNVVPMSVVKVVDKDKVMLMDAVLVKTYKNLQENPKATITASYYREWELTKQGEFKVKPIDMQKWIDKVFDGWQFKGDIEIVTEGEYFELARKMCKDRFGEFVPCRSALVLHVKEIYSVLDGSKVQ